MCGIVAIVGKEAVAPRLFGGLKRLEYRGYDSAGICTVANGTFERQRAEGKLENLAAKLAEDSPAGTIGVAHTRWATHGAPTVGNAHPHIAGPVALVHNGIIENFKPLRDELIADGRTFLSETDSEVVAHLVAREVERGAAPEAAVATVLPRLHGAFAIAFLFRDHPDLVIGARMGAPLTVGFGEGENYLGSDAIALAPWTRRIAYLDEGDWVVCRRDGVQIFDRTNAAVERRVVDSGAESEIVSARSKARWRCRPPTSTCLRSSASPWLRAAPVSMPAWSPNTGLNSLRACPSTSMSHPNSGTASRCSSRADWPSSSRNLARPPTRLPRFAMPVPTARRLR
jgi:glucosamine--fructose-6-phosphate aminotransferase (isomerizing)